MSDYCTKLCSNANQKIFKDPCDKNCRENTRVLQEFYLDLKNKYKLNDDDLKYLYYCYNFCSQPKNVKNSNCLNDCESNSELIKSNTLNDLLNKKIKVDNNDDKNNKQVNELINSNLSLCEFISKKVDVHNNNNKDQGFNKINLQNTRCPYAANNDVDLTMKNWVSIYCKYCKDEKEGGKPKSKSKSKPKSKSKTKKKKKNYKKKTKTRRKKKRKGNKRRKTHKKKK